MEFRDLKKQYLLYKEEIDSAIENVLMRTDFINGYPVGQLEERLAEYVGTKHCITCANGTDALQLALMTWGIGTGDAVFIPDFTFFSTGEVVPLVGATPIFVDIDADTYNMSPESLENAIRFVTGQTDLQPRVIIAVDLFGQPADYGKIRKIADRYHLFLLEDGAQGFGGSMGDKRACSFGDIATTSFFPAKPLGCYGDGGAIFTNNNEWETLLRSYKVHGKGEDKYDNVRIGMNSRLDTLQAAVLDVKLDIFRKSELNAVNRVALLYTERLRNIVKAPVVLEGYLSSWAQYSILCSNTTERSAIQKALKDKGIPSMVYYQKPLHMQDAFHDVKYIHPEDLPVTTDICQRILSLPMHPYLEVGEIDEISHIIESICSK